MVTHRISRKKLAISTVFRGFPHRPPLERRELTGTYGELYAVSTVFGSFSRESQNRPRENGLNLSELEGVMYNPHGVLKVPVGIPTYSFPWERWQTGWDNPYEPAETVLNSHGVSAFFSRGSSHGLLWGRREPTQTEHGKSCTWYYVHYAWCVRTHGRRCFCRGKMESHCRSSAPP